jgi:hypothetical protein
MNKTEITKGQALFSQIQDRYNKLDSLIGGKSLTGEQLAVLGNLISQVAVMFREEKKVEK